MNIANNKILWIAPIVGLVASIVLSFTTFQYELKNEHSSFTAESNLLFNNIKVSFDELDTVNKNITLLFNTSDVISENRFNLFTKPSLSHYPFIESIYYIPRIKKTDLKKIELQKQNIGYTSFKFRTFPEDTYSPTPSEKYIFPIDFVQPFTVINSTLVGMDILTFNLVQKEIMLSTQMGNTLVFSPGKNNFYAFSSLYYGNKVPNSYEMNIDNVYAILGYKISTSKLLSYIAFPDKYTLNIYINNKNTLPEITVNTNSFFMNSYSASNIFDINRQQVEFIIQYSINIFEHDFTLPLFILLTGLLLTFLSWYTLKTNIVFNDFLYQQNKTIEAEVNEKTEQLKIAFEEQVNATNELKSFSYSVSHDLRAPLRSVDGFCKILDEDYSDKLDDTGRDYLLRIRHGAQHMGELIDSMLNLALVSHKDIKHESVPLSLFANDIITQLKAAYPERQVDVVIASDLTVTGDKILLHSVMDNLLNNAWKFTEKTDKARIEFNKKTVDNEDVYFITDNGVGFDMAYANKLFKPFQRLHGKQFNGTGIGLATVERIIKRHRGKITVSAIQNEGATFSFTLGQKLS